MTRLRNLLIIMVDYKKFRGDPSGSDPIFLGYLVNPAVGKVIADWWQASA